jgi:hypothetical protein
MTCKFYVTEEYDEKLEKLFEAKDVFEVDAFKISHEIVIVDEVSMPRECDVHAADIFAINDMTYDVFLEHVGCYFKR